jgi:hypothetical protein
VSSHAQRVRAAQAAIKKHPRFKAALAARDRKVQEHHKAAYQKAYRTLAHLSPDERQAYARFHAAGSTFNYQARLDAELMRTKFWKNLGKSIFDEIRHLFGL